MAPTSLLLPIYIKLYCDGPYIAPTSLLHRSYIAPTSLLHLSFLKFILHCTYFDGPYIAPPSPLHRSSIAPISLLHRPYIAPSSLLLEIYITLYLL